MTETSAPKRPKKAKAVPKGSHRADKPVEPVELAPGYRGLLALALNSGQITSINVQAVRRNDLFDYAYGLKERLEHVPAEGDRGDITHFYAYARFKDGGHCFDVLSRAEVDAVRDRRGGPPWGTDPAELGKEIAIRRIYRYLPLALQKAAALAEPGEIVADHPEPVPKPVTDAPAEEPEPPGPPGDQPHGRGARGPLPARPRHADPGRRGRARHAGRGAGRNRRRPSRRDPAGRRIGGPERHLLLAALSATPPRSRERIRP